MLESAIEKLRAGQSLTLGEARGSMQEIMQGGVPAPLLAEFLTRLRDKGETVEEIAGCAQAMRDAAIQVKAKSPIIVDTCGTGGDAQGTFNISTAAALIVAGAGFTVAKHGNRSISSRCGSADLLEAVGVKVDAPPAVAERCLEEIGIAFLFAPVFHPAMRHAMPVRRQLGGRTIFNVLGPLTNPAHANAQLIGVFAPEWVEKIAQVSVLLGLRESWVVHGAGQDELTLAGETRVAEVHEGRVRTFTLTPEEAGFSRVDAPGVQGGARDENAKTLMELLRGKKTPLRDAVLFNAGAALWIAHKASRSANSRDLRQAVQEAAVALESGRALEKLEQLRALTCEAVSRNPSPLEGEGMGEGE